MTRLVAWKVPFAVEPVVGHRIALSAAEEIRRVRRTKVVVLVMVNLLAVAVPRK